MLHFDAERLLWQLKLQKANDADDPISKQFYLQVGIAMVTSLIIQNERTRFMFNLGAGGGAMILQKEYGKYRLLESDMITDGSFSEDVVVPVGGTKEPLTAEHFQTGIISIRCNGSCRNEGRSRTKIDAKLFKSHSRFFSEKWLSQKKILIISSHSTYEKICP